ncbi:MAG: hydrogenase 4 subunit F [Alistipes sp.]|nr:hydrogenase 4 subunit F [Alistipes sp.]MBR2111162.1 hydrogenase 4 subunit F [Alistipes sp.]MBR2436611.1 hydrogenase 4 subunit F [Alistipes sp.]MBR3590509.1 hydrogenase 4 subunit F [Alistipes sp.]MBR6631098.1 hydrogenase 4 subunit F [Alistipes sp.]
MLTYIIVSLLIAIAPLASRSERVTNLIASLFALVQVASVALLFVFDRFDTALLTIFRADTLAVVFHVLMIAVLIFSLIHSSSYLRAEKVTTRSYNAYYTLLMLLALSITCVYYSYNLAMTWVFLELTTICSAGIIYHREFEQSLEATWKYIFVCSTGIAMAYLGILLLSTVAVEGTLDYAALKSVIAEGNPLYLKLAFLLIVIGYSCKMEVFPLYTVGVDANFAAPAPASAFISTALVNAGFVSIMRIYTLYASSEVFAWARNVLILIGILSLAVGAMFLRRTNNYKRFLSYSTVENMGIVAIGMGIGGVALWAAVFHVMCHTFIKSSMFYHVGVMRHIYDSYSINRIGNYMNINRIGAIGLIVGTLLLLAFPPSPLFVTEVMLFSEIATQGRWWLLILMVVLMCVVLYAIWSRSLRLNYHSNQDELHLSEVNRRLSYSASVLLIVAIIVGIWQPAELMDIIDSIVNLQ